MELKSYQEVIQYLDKKERGVNLGTPYLFPGPTDRWAREMIIDN